MLNYKYEISQVIDNYIKTHLINDFNINLVDLFNKPEKDIFGDFSLPCFRLSPILKKSPVQIADLFLIPLKHIPFILKSENVNGYLNIYLDPTVVFSNLVESFFNKTKNFLENEEFSKKTILVEFSSPNIAKPFSIGHLRSTVIGNFLSNLYKSVGANVISINHIGDWGTQFGKLIVAFNLWGSVETLQKDPVNHLLELYIKFHSESESNNNLENKAREAFKNLENGQEMETNLWTLFKEYSYLEFENTYQRLNVKFDHTTGESFYSDKIETVLDLLLYKKLLKESENAVVVDLDKFNMPPCLIKKSDGATLYATRDLAAAIYRNNEFNFDNMFYVVGAEQSLHFKQFFKVLELADESYSKKMEHIAFGLYRFKDGKMSTRKGKVILLNDVLNEAVNRVLSIMETKNPDLTNTEKKEISEILGTSAVIYNDLKNDRIKDVNFTWDEVLSMEGDSGPFISYSYVRCLSILKKSNFSTQTILSNIKIRDDSESQLIRKLNEFGEAIESCIKTRKSHHLTTYLLELTKKFHSFYHNCRVLGEDDETTQFRLSLVKLTSIAIKSGTEILGMKLPEKM